MPDLAVESKFLAIENVGVVTRMRDAVFFRKVVILSVVAPGLAFELFGFVVELEEECLVLAVSRVGSWVDAEFDEGVAPGAAFELVADEGNGLFELVDAGDVAYAIEEGSSGPDRALFHCFFQSGDEFLDGLVGGLVSVGFGRNLFNVVTEIYDTALLWFRVIDQDSIPFGVLLLGEMDSLVPAPVERQRVT